MVRWIFLGLLVLLTATAASADDRGAPDPCDGALFAGPVPTFRSGDFLPAEGVFALALQHRPFQFVPAAVRIDDVTCPNPAELRVEGGAVTLQLSDAAEPLIRVAVIRLRDRTAPAPPR